MSIIKPRLWNVDPALVDPKWRFLWELGASAWLFYDRFDQLDVGPQGKHAPILSGAGPTSIIGTPHGPGVAVDDTGFDPTWVEATDSTWWFIATRNADTTAPTDTSTVQVVVASRLNSESAGLEINLGNGFGLSADKNKPRASTLVGDATITAWLDGVKQSGVNPFDTALVNGQYYIIVVRFVGHGTKGSDLRFFRQNNTTPYSLDGTCPLLGYVPYALSDANCLRLSSDPFGPFTMDDSLDATIVYALAAAAAAQWIDGGGTVNRGMKPRMWAIR